MAGFPDGLVLLMGRARPRPPPPSLQTGLRATHSWSDSSTTGTALPTCTQGFAFSRRALLGITSGTYGVWMRMRVCQKLLLNNFS